MNRNRVSLHHWLGFKNPLAKNDCPTAGRIFGNILAVVGLGLLCFILWLFLVVVENLVQPEGEIETARTASYLLIGSIGLPFLAWRNYVAQRQANVAEQGLATERITKAVEQLGAYKVVKTRAPTQQTDINREPIMGDSFEETVPNVELHIGGLFELERIKNDNLADHIRIMEMICAYIRENSKYSQPSVFMPDEYSGQGATSLIQIAIDILSRRSKEQIDFEVSERFRMNLSGANLQGIDFKRGDFSAAMFIKCNLRHTNLVFCRLRGTLFQHSNLEYASFHQNDLTGAQFDYATINHKRETWRGYFEVSSILRGTSFVAVNMPGVSIAGSENRFAESFGTKDSIFASDDDIDLGDDSEKEKTPRFENWSRWSSNDMATNFLKKELLEKLGLIDWPYIG